MNEVKESAMKKTVLVSAMGFIGLAFSGVAGAEEVGRVISSTPVVQQIPVQRQVCNPQPVAVQPQSSGAGAVIGGIVGGLLGHGVGGGFGRAAATGVGVVAGAAVGDSLERRGEYPQQAMAQQCATQTSYENRTVAYNVQYEYAGKTFNVQMPYDPGPTIRLQVSPVSANEAPEDAEAVAAAPAGPAPVYAPQTPSAVYPAYAYPAYGYAAPYPYYARPYWYPPVSISLGYVWGGGHHWHR
jgi:uncharacterized protein YcfJ